MKSSMQSCSKLDSKSHSKLRSKSHSKPYIFFVVLAAVFVSATAEAQQMYKWIGRDGKINYTDTPPPASAKASEIKSSMASGGGTGLANLPYELAQAAQNNPVIFYTSADCAPCDSGRTMLSARGIPFTEKTVKTAEDGLRLKQAGGAETLPLLLVGRSKQNGFEATGWATMLTAAGYPESSKLPATYRNPTPQPAAPKIVKDTPPVKKTPDPTPVAAPVSTPASGFRF